MKSCSNSFSLICLQLNKCPATVNEKDDTFYLGLKEHNHGPNVDSAANAVIIREVKKRAMDNVFKPATAIVHEVNNIHKPLYWLYVDIQFGFKLLIVVICY